MSIPMSTPISKPIGMSAPISVPMTTHCSISKKTKEAVEQLRLLTTQDRRVSVSLEAPIASFHECNMTKESFWQPAA